MNLFGHSSTIILRLLRQHHGGRRNIRCDVGLLRIRGRYRRRAAVAEASDAEGASPAPLLGWATRARAGMWICSVCADKYHVVSPGEANLENNCPLSCRKYSFWSKAGILWVFALSDMVHGLTLMFGCAQHCRTANIKQEENQKTSWRRCETARGNALSASPATLAARRPGEKHPTEIALFLPGSFPCCAQYYRQRVTNTWDEHKTRHRRNSQAGRGGRKRSPYVVVWWKGGAHGRAL